MRIGRSLLGGLPLLLCAGLAISSCEIVAGVEDPVLAECKPGDTRECYSGPDGTKGVGICRPGSQTCKEDGSGFGECADEVRPAEQEDCSNELDDTCSGMACGQAVWTQSFDTAGDEETQLLSSTAVDSKGNIYVASHFAKTAVFGDKPLSSSSARSVYLVKLDPQGTPLWAKEFGDGDVQKNIKIGVTSKDEVVIATTPGNGTIDFGNGAIGPNGTAVAMFGGDGTLKWQRSLGGSMGVRGFAVDPESDASIVVGSFSGMVDLGDGNPVNSQGASGDLFVTKLSASGATVWAKAFGDSDPAQAAEQVGWNAVVGEGGRILVTGVFGGTLVFDSPVTAKGAQSLFVAALDGSGAPQWLRDFGDAETQAVLPFAMVSAPGGGSVVGGLFLGKISFNSFVKTTQPGDQGNGFVVRLDADGHYSWAQAFGDVAEQEVLGLAVDTEGNVLVGGGFAGTADFGGGAYTSKGDVDAFLVKYGPSGDHLWSRARGNAAAFQLVGSMALDPVDGTLVVAGANNGTLDFGSGAISSKNDIDLFVAKIAPQ